jgi:hypothetical protein
VIWRFALDASPPRTKKNSPIIVSGLKHPILLPSQAYRDWFKAHEWAITSIRVNLNRQNQITPHNGPVSVNAQFYCDNDRGDCCGYYQALGDLLEWHTRDKHTKIVTYLGLITDDRWIRDWDGSRLHLDRARPRIEVAIEILPRDQPELFEDLPAESEDQPP